MSAVPKDPDFRRLSDRFGLYHLGTEDLGSSFEDEVRAGLSSNPKALPPRYLYDTLGSILFDAICELPEYYLTRAEAAILGQHSKNILSPVAPPIRIVELGSGSSTKTRALLEAALHQQNTLEYLPVDVSDSALRESSRALLNLFPDLTIHGFVADYFRALDWLAAPEHACPGVRTVILFLGSTIGNLNPEERRELLTHARAVLQPGDAFLLGADLKKDETTLLAAYNDTLGVTASFNKNVLVHLNRALEANFDPSLFAHRPRYDSELGRVEMHLESLRDQQVTLGALDLTVSFHQGETIHTESSHKFDRQLLEGLAKDTGFTLHQQWLDPDERFSENLFIAC
ncbi:MAG: L-histidine N(alpha)-methyltransferase [Acidobacteriota bacterium]